MADERERWTVEHGEWGTLRWRRPNDRLQVQYHAPSDGRKWCDMPPAATALMELAWRLAEQNARRADPPQPEASADEGEDHPLIAAMAFYLYSDSHLDTRTNERVMRHLRRALEETAAPDRETVGEREDEQNRPWWVVGTTKPPCVNCGSQSWGVAYRMECDQCRKDVVWVNPDDLLRLFGNDRVWYIRAYSDRDENATVPLPVSLPHTRTPETADE